MTLYVFDDEDGSVGFNIIDGLFSSPEYTEFRSSSLIPTITKFTLLLLIGSLRLSGEEFTSFNRKGSFVSKFSSTFSTIECIIESMFPLSTWANTSLLLFLPLLRELLMLALAKPRLLTFSDDDVILTVGLSLSMSMSILSRIT